MSSISIYHYVYRITNTIIGKHYYGTRTSKGITPEEDIGKKYFSSSRDINFIYEQQNYPENFKYKVVRKFNTREAAIEFEIILHDKFNVKNHSNFFNKSNQTSTGFDCFGVKISEKELERRKEFMLGDGNWMRGRTGELCPAFGKVTSEETKEKLRVKALLRSHSEETREKLSILSSGKNNPNYGKTHSEETREKIKLSLANKQLIVCPYCGKSSKGSSAMSRWHGDNCKNK